MLKKENGVIELRLWLSKNSLKALALIAGFGFGLEGVFEMYHRGFLLGLVIGIVASLICLVTAILILALEYKARRWPELLKSPDRLVLFWEEAKEPERQLAVDYFLALNEFDFGQILARLDRYGKRYPGASDDALRVRREIYDARTRQEK